MNHCIGWIGLTVGIALGAGSQTATGQGTAPLKVAAKPGPPRLQFSETTFDFGNVKLTDTLKHEFIFTNTGAALLEITNVVPGCGCTTTGEWDRQVQPGKTGRIPVQFNPAEFGGPVSKFITAMCNDPAQGAHALQIQATVWRPVEAQPQYLPFVLIEGEETNETRSVRIVSNQEEVVTLEAPRSINPLFQTALKTVRPGKEFELLVTYSGPLSNAAPRGNILIQTSAATIPLSVTAYVMPQPAVVVAPRAVQLPPSPLGAGQRLTVMVYTYSTRPVKLSGATVNAKGVEVMSQEQDSGRNFSLKLSFPAGFAVPADQPVELTLMTSHPRYPVIKLPITHATPARPADGAK